MKVKLMNWGVVTHEPALVHKGHLIVKIITSSKRTQHCATAHLQLWLSPSVSVVRGLRVSSDSTKYRNTSRNLT